MSCLFQQSRAGLSSFPSIIPTLRLIFCPTLTELYRTCLSPSWTFLLSVMEPSRSAGSLRIASLRNLRSMALHDWSTMGFLERVCHIVLRPKEFFILLPKYTLDWPGYGLDQQSKTTDPLWIYALLNLVRYRPMFYPK